MEPDKNGAFGFNMTDEDFGKLSSFIYEELGIKMPYAKKFMLQGRLKNRLTDLRMKSFKEYIEFIFSREGMKDEITKMIDLVTTNKTDFFRESDHFEFLTKKALPEICSGVNEKKLIKIWSAGCSSGEEPYSIAIVLNEFLQMFPDFNFEIFATDISLRILQKAAIAIYSEDKISVVPLALKRKYFLRSRDKSNKTVRLIPELRTKVSFQRLNFMDTYYFIENEFDIVFCRNVLIYFDLQTQEKIIVKIASKLKNDGLFFIGHSESMINMIVPFKQIEPTIFRKITPIKRIN
jgi:chemotaxis protein methyltransferase CheR